MEEPPETDPLPPTEPSPETEVTRLLREAAGGSREAADLLLPRVYAELRRLAGSKMSREKPGQTLQPTALVHEAYLRMAQPEKADWQDRQHFLRVAALAMRQLLTSYARRKGARKRSGGERVLLEETDRELDEGGVDLVVLHEALEELRELHERQAEIVELRFLTGLTLTETAEVLGVSERTVSLDWRMARNWLERRLADS